MSMAEISEEMLADWLVVPGPSFTPGMSCAGQLGDTGESLRLGHARSAEGPG